MKLIHPLRAAARVLTRPLERQLVGLVYPAGTEAADFLAPPGEPALLAVDSVSWRIFSNPVAIFVGGVTAVLLELAEPRVRTGVWEHTTFREKPLQRMQRTGYAAMMTAFGARSRAEAMIERINHGHARIRGRTPSGQSYHASDDELLTWVHATATFGFLEAYRRCVRDLPLAKRDRFYVDNQPGARLYGVQSPPASQRDLDALFERMHPQLEASEIVLEFLAIVGRMRLLPAPVRGVQLLLIRAAVQNLPPRIRKHLGLEDAKWRVARWQWAIVRMLGRAADHLTFSELPSVLARRRIAV